MLAHEIEQALAPTMDKAQAELPDFPDNSEGVMVVTRLVMDRSKQGDAGMYARLEGRDEATGKRCKVSISGLDSRLYDTAEKKQAQLRQAVAALCRKNDTDPVPGNAKGWWDVALKFSVSSEGVPNKDEQYVATLANGLRLGIKTGPRQPTRDGKNTFTKKTFSIAG